MTEDEMVGWHHRLDGHEFKQAPRAGDGQGNLACCSPWGRKELDMTKRLNDWTELTEKEIAHLLFPEQSARPPYTTRGHWGPHHPLMAYTDLAHSWLPGSQGTAPSLSHTLPSPCQVALWRSEVCGLQSSNCALFKGNEQLQCVHKASVKPTWFGRVAEPLKKKKVL